MSTMKDYTKIYYHTEDGEPWTIVVKDEHLDRVILLLRDSGRKVKYTADVEDGCCRHGVYVGGCGVDYMCPYCESDDGYRSDYSFQRVLDLRLKITKPGVVLVASFDGRECGTLHYLGNNKFRYFWNVVVDGGVNMFTFETLPKLLDNMAEIGEEIDWKM